MNISASDSWESTYRHFVGLVRTVGKRATLAPDVIEDLCHQVLEKFLARQETLRGENCDAWLVRVAQNAARDIYRRQAAFRKMSAAYVFDEASLEIEDACIHRMLLERVTSAISALPPEQGFLIDLAFVRDFTHAEIAAMTALPIGTVKTRIRSGLKRLRLMSELSTLAEMFGGSPLTNGTPSSVHHRRHAQRRRPLIQAAENAYR